MPDEQTGKAVIFDLDGTLINTIADIAAAIHPILVRNGYPLHETSDYKRFVGSGLRQAMVNAFPADHGRSDEEIDSMYEELMAGYRSSPYACSSLYEGIEGILAALNESGVPNSILSNKEHSLVLTIVEHLLGEFRFTGVMGLSDRYEKKPDPGSALSLCVKMGCRAEDTILIGDSEVDYMTAEAAGMQPIIVSWGFRTKGELLDSIPEHRIVDTPQELEERLLTSLAV